MASTSQRSGDLRHRELRILEAHHRCSGNDAQIVDAGEASDESLGHSVGKVFLCWISGQVLQRQYRQRPDFGLRRTIHAASGREVSDSKQAEYDQHLPEQTSRAPAVSRFVGCPPSASTGASDAFGLRPPRPNSACGFAARHRARNLRRKRNPACRVRGGGPASPPAFPSAGP